MNDYMKRRDAAFQACPGVLIEVIEGRVVITLAGEGDEGQKVHMMTVTSWRPEELSKYLMESHESVLTPGSHRVAWSFSSDGKGNLLSKALGWTYHRMRAFVQEFNDLVREQEES
jgi:hypothetical protein